MNTGSSTWQIWFPEWDLMDHCQHLHLSGPRNFCGDRQEQATLENTVLTGKQMFQMHPISHSLKKQFLSWDWKGTFGITARLETPKAQKPPVLWGKLTGSQKILSWKGHTGSWSPAAGPASCWQTSVTQSLCWMTLPNKKPEGTGIPIVIPRNREHCYKRGAIAGHRGNGQILQISHHTRGINMPLIDPRVLISVCIGGSWPFLYSLAIFNELISCRNPKLKN